jgi:hypothetical protein
MINLEIDDAATKRWYNEKGELHRKDGPAVEYFNGGKEWWINNKLHREDGPAVEYIDGDQEWYIDGKRHREDGPAVEYASGTKEWWYNGEYISCRTQKEFEKIIKLRMFW